MFLALLQRDLKIHFRQPSEVLNPLVFFAVVISLFPLGLGPSPDELSKVAPAVIWIAALLATLMSLDVMFRGDFEDGSLEQVVISETSLFVYVLAKVTVHWIVSGLPLVLLMPFVGLALFLETEAIVMMTLALLLVSPTLSLLGAIGAALTVGLTRGGLLVTILILPLYVPVLILATSMTQSALLGADVAGFFYWLLAVLLLALGLAPIATAAAVRISVDQ